MRTAAGGGCSLHSLCGLHKTVTGNASLRLEDQRTKDEKAMKKIAILNIIAINALMPTPGHDDFQLAIQLNVCAVPLSVLQKTSCVKGSGVEGEGRGRRGGTGGMGV